ncbi:MAG: flagellar type III secretion system pore protein FliP [Candidatus Methylomirabilis oxygeniifera]|nr:MAG: flagellar type III secretion system pore protein FliP [Candidatus Methylomirabilis oxyfera]
MGIGTFVAASPLAVGPSFVPIPQLPLVAGGAGSAEPTVAVQLVILLTLLAMAPALVIMLTSFSRIIIVLSFLRTAMGTQQMPPNQVLIGLTLFLTFFVMAPVGEQINREALQPYLSRQLAQEAALERALQPLRTFMFKQTRERDLALMVHLARLERPKDRAAVPTHVLVPAYAISELRTAFQIGFVLFIPFLVIDMVVSSVLISMGMLFLPPPVISFPFKLLLFVLADGWHLVVRSLVIGFQ